MPKLKIASALVGQRRIREYIHRLPLDDHSKQSERLLYSKFCFVEIY